MIERDLAHLRFLSAAVSKGDYLGPEDLEWVEKKKDGLERILEGIDEMLAMNSRRMDMLAFAEEMPYGAYFELWSETVRQMSIDKTTNEGIYFEEADNGNTGMEQEE